MILADAVASDALGRALAAVVRPGDVIALSGPLGAGKTSIARGILSALGLAGEAPSPSYAIVQPYDPPEVRMPVLHVDCYRLEDPAEARELGLEEERSGALMIVEWPEHGPAEWGADALALTLVPLAQGGRALTARVPAAWKGRWPLT